MTSLENVRDRLIPPGMTLGGAFPSILSRRSKLVTRMDSGEDDDPLEEEGLVHGTYSRLREGSDSTGDCPPGAFPVACNSQGSRPVVGVGGRVVSYARSGGCGSVLVWRLLWLHDALLSSKAGVPDVVGSRWVWDGLGLLKGGVKRELEDASALLDPAVWVDLLHRSGTWPVGIVRLRWNPKVGCRVRRWESLLEW